MAGSCVRVCGAGTLVTGDCSSCVTATVGIGPVGVGVGGVGVGGANLERRLPFGLFLGFVIALVSLRFEILQVPVNAGLRA